MATAPVENLGYIEDREHQDAFAAESIALYGSPLDTLRADMDRPAFPFRAAAYALRGSRYVKIVGSLLMLQALSQGRVGSCVGWGEARKIFLTLAAGVYMRGEPIETIRDNQGNPVWVSPAWCYGASRQVVGKLGRWDGSNGSWAARATAELGFVFEKRYPNGFDASQYSAADCKRWAAGGVPPESLEIAAQQKLRGRIRVESFEQLVALCQAGYCVNACGWDKPIDTRDEYGFCPIGGRWAHSQTSGICYVVYKMKPGKIIRGIGVLNSHGSSRYGGPGGPLTPDLPGGAYIFDEKSAQRGLDRGDTWASFDLEGLKPAAKNWEARAEKHAA